MNAGTALTGCAGFHIDGQGKPMKIISYAQNYEDVLLNRLFPDRPGGFYIDVGAYHPVFHSVTKLFYERGWQGVNIEPIPSMFKLLADDRPRDVNLHMGLSNVEGNLTFYEVPADMLCRPSPQSTPKASGKRVSGSRRGRYPSRPSPACVSSTPGRRSTSSRSTSRATSGKCWRGGLGPLPAAGRPDRGHPSGHAYS